MNLAFAADGNYLRQLLVAAGSAVYAARGETGRLVVDVLDCGLSDDGWATFDAAIRRLAASCGANVDLARHAVDLTSFARLGGWTNGSKAIWARLLLPKILPDAERCVYSDCDMLFVASPFELLKAVRSSDALLAGHLDLRSSRSQAAAWCRRQGLSADEDGYVCSGLLVMNLRAFREDGLVEKCLDFAARHPDARYPDQTTLNQVCLGRTETLPGGWGLFPQECQSFGGRIRAIHFAGGFPWRTRCESHNCAMALRRSGEACALWRDFETRVLGLAPSVAVRPPWKFRLLDRAATAVARTASLLGVRIGHGSFQDAVAAFDGRTPALSLARRELFGESGTKGRAS